MSIWVPVTGTPGNRQGETMGLLDVVRKAAETRLRVLEVQERLHDFQRRRDLDNLRRQRQAQQSASASPQPASTSRTSRMVGALLDKTAHQGHLPAEIRSLHPGGRYEAKAIFWSAQRYSLRQQATVSAWQVSIRQTFLTGNPLVTISRPGIGNTRLFPARITLTAPEDGVLIAIRQAAGTSLLPGEPLATYVPLTQWRAFVTLLDRHQRTIEGYQAAAVPIRRERAAVQRELRDAAAQEAALTRQVQQLQQQKQALAGVRFRQQQILHRTPVDELAGILLQQPPDAIMGHPAGQQTLQDLFEAIQQVLELDSGLSFGELLRAADDVQKIARIEAVFTAQDQVMLQICRDISLSEAERRDRLEAQIQQRLEVVGRVFGGRGR